MASGATARIASFKAFWPCYVSQHSKSVTRWLHFVGTLVATSALVILIVVRLSRFIPLAFVFGYAMAWFGHFFVEKNRPATFEYPLWSFLADYKMAGLMLAGKMDAEVRKAMPKKTATQDELL
ncbi:MAG: DUF962 domain-containing protein [Acidobacteriia bacterium]|nr:DUF962 domain-containing protein [Terriglobia bacterium]